jgi:hypothetical protein
MNRATVTGKVIEIRCECDSEFDYLDEPVPAIPSHLKLKIEKEGFPGHFRYIWLYCPNEEYYCKIRRMLRTSEYWYFEYERETKQIYHFESSQWHCCLQ